MSANEIEALVLLNKLSSKEVVTQLCEDAFATRKNNKYAEDVVKRTCQAAGTENAQLAAKLLQSTYSLATRCLKANYERPEQAVQGLPCDQTLVPTLSFVLPLWRSLALKHIISPPRLVSFSAQVCTKSGVSDNAATQASCLLNLTLEENGEEERLCVELSKSKMSALVADLGLVRDQLTAIASQK